MLISKKSKSVTQSRMDKMRVANRGVMKILLETQLQVLKEITKNESQYAQLLTKLIVQGLVKLNEEVVKIVCLERDVKLVNSVLRKAKGQYEQKCKQELGKNVNLQLSVDTQNFLRERKEKDFLPKNLQLDDYSGSLKYKPLYLDEKELDISVEERRRKEEKMDVDL